MSPSAIVTISTGNEGKQLEETSDNVESVHVLKAELEDEAFHKSQFDSEKDKTKFRQYEDACDRVKNFYCEQHEKQTVAYNLKARNEFRFEVRAEMTIWEAMERYSVRVPIIILNI